MEKDKMDAGWFTVKLSAKDKLAQRMMEKARRLPLADYENADFYAIVTRANKGIESSLLAMFDNIVQMAGFLAALISAVSSAAVRWGSISVTEGWRLRGRNWRQISIK